MVPEEEALVVEARETPTMGAPISDVVREMLSRSDGRTQLAQTMINPLRRRLDYQGVARRLLSVEPLPAGALPIYDRDPEPGVARRVMVPTFELESNPTVQIGAVRSRRFDIIERSQNATLREISRWPKHFVMGSWVRHVKYGYYAQVVDAVNKELALLDIWDGHNFSELPNDIFLDSEGHISVYIDTVDQWVGVEEPVLPPSIWEILDEDD